MFHIISDAAALVSSLRVTYCVLVYRAARPRALCDALAPSMGLHADICQFVETAERGQVWEALVTLNAVT